MLDKKNLLALAAAAMLAACGGGESTGSNHEAAAGAMRAHVLSAGPARAVAAAAVAPDEAARQLMDYAESVAAFKAYFPEHQATLTYGPFKYRQYSSGVLLGVVVSADPNYILNGVYVMGGAFGNSPQYVGQLTTYITPVDPNPNPDPGGPPGANNGCSDLSLVETQGTRLIIDYSYSGIITGTVKSDSLVGSLTTFEGQQAREQTTKTTGSTTTAGQTVALELETKSYQRKTGDAEVTNYGLVSVTKTSIQGIEGSTTSKTVWTPAWVDRTWGLAIGGSLTQTESGTVTSTTTYSIPGFPPQTTTTPVNSSETIKYVGRETVTVPAGTYNTCKFEHRSGTSTTELSTNWLIVGKGVPVKTVSGTGSEMLTIQATSITLNGQRL